jgi:hypothetical protein
MEASEEASSTKINSTKSFGYDTTAIDCNKPGRFSDSFLNGMITENFVVGITSAGLNSSTFIKPIAKEIIRIAYVENRKIRNQIMLST